MSAIEFQLDGIYDQRTLKLLQQVEIRHLSFDFRPTSFNFFQLHRCLDLLKSNFSFRDHYYFHFANEADFVIKKILDDVSLLALPSHLHSWNLIFSDAQPGTFYDQFECPYYLYYRTEFDAAFLRGLHHLQGLILPFFLLEDLHRKNQLIDFLKRIMSITAGRNITLVLSADWDANFFPSLFEYFDFERIIISIDKRVEVCYRNVDLNLLQKNITILKAMLK